MEKRIEFSNLNSRHLHDVVRCIPGDCERISGYLLSMEYPSNADPMMQNVLLINDDGVSLHKADKIPGLIDLFISKRRIDKVVFEVSRLHSCTEYRSFAADLVERGYGGRFAFLKNSDGDTPVERLGQKFSIGFDTTGTPMSVAVYYSDYLGEKTPQAIERILKACDELWLPPT